ncbi:MAG: endolytic transglycosylase MltG [Patescibacteria group bacterium]
MKGARGIVMTLTGVAAGGMIAVLFLPTLVSFLHAEIITPFEPEPFTLSVDPIARVIREEPPAVEQLSFRFLQRVAAFVAEQPWYQSVALVGLPTTVTIQPGSRKEQVARAFGTALKWDRKATLAIDEGMLFPSTYLVSPGMTPTDVEALINAEFNNRVLERYATSTREVVPVADALTIASMLEREAGNAEEMRIISGIIWNRIFAGMRLQLDATLSYARGTGSNGWWPVPRSRDKYIKSDYNTYMHSGLPPGPISNPSVAAIIAALNPRKTDCMFYFHSKTSEFFCSVTYEEHVALLKEQYGRGR